MYQNLDNNFATAIAILLRLGSPSHVARFVMTVVVYSIYRVLRRRLSAQFIKELCKRGEAKFNPSTAVVFIGFASRVVTALLGRAICGIFWRIGFTMFDSLHASTACAPTRRAVAQGSKRNNTSLAALANAIPHAQESRIGLADLFLTRIGEHRPISKRLALHVNLSTGDGTRMARPGTGSKLAEGYGVFSAAGTSTEPVSHAIARTDASEITQDSPISNDLSFHINETRMLRFRDDSILLSHTIKANSFNLVVRATAVLKSLTWPASILRSRTLTFNGLVEV